MLFAFFFNIFFLKRVACCGRCPSYGIDLLLARQLFCDFGRLFQVFQVTFDPVHFAGVTVFLELFHRFVGVFFFLG